MHSLFQLNLSVYSQAVQSVTQYQLSCLKKRLNALMFAFQWVSFVMKDIIIIIKTVKSFCGLL